LFFKIKRLFMKRLVLCGVFSLALVTTAAAGNATLKKDGKSYALSCVDSGCYLTERISLFKSGEKKRLGPGGVANFKMWRTKLKSQGYK
tara:strand:- start:10344 stop:10610 length:267 start_codon:yes stop_codon:yes gene_type:complete